METSAPVLVSAGNVNQNSKLFDIIDQPFEGLSSNRASVCPSSTRTGFVYAADGTSIANIFPSKQISVSLGNNDYLTTPDAIIDLQFQIGMENTIAKELVPSTAIFGKVYSIDRTYLVQQQANGTIQPGSIQVKLTTDATHINAVIINGITITENNQMIAGNYWKWVAGTGGLVINDTELVSTQAATINNNTFLETFNGNYLKGLTINGVSCYTNETTEKTTTVPFIQVDQYNNAPLGPKIACAKIMPSALSFIDNATLSCGTLQENVTQVYRKGFENQKRIPRDVQGNQFSQTLFDYIEGGSIVLDTRYYNYAAATNGQQIKTILPVPAPTRATTAASYWGMLPATGATTLPANYASYIQDGWGYKSADNANNSNNDIIQFVKLIHVKIPLNMLFKCMSPPVFFCGLFGQNAKLNLQINYQQYQAANLFAGQFKYGSAFGKVTDPTSGNMYPLDTTANIPLFSQNLTGYVQSFLSYKVYHNKALLDNERVKPIIHFPFKNYIYSTLPNGGQIISGQPLTAVSQRSATQVQVWQQFNSSISSTETFSPLQSGCHTMLSPCMLVDSYNAGFNIDQCVYMSQFQLSYGDENYMQDPITDMNKFIDVVRQSFNADSNYVTAGAFRNIFEYLCIYGDVTMNLEGCQFITKYNIIRDGQNLANQQLKVSSNVSVYNNLQGTNKYNIQNVLLLNSDSVNVNQYNPNYNILTKKMLWQYIVEYETNLYYYPQQMNAVLDDVVVEYQEE